ncbi:hypothetical protein [Actinomadura fulvescens]|uniref:hypothetical protein n=1 Tax=Actinomadura fulvescens TaxID=46160 RepID=UPI0031E39470
MPTPDLRDADDRPLWFATTIDAWAASTGRATGADAVWLHTAPAATTPAPTLFHGVIHPVLTAGAEGVGLHAVVWGTDHGHLVYLTPLDDAPVEALRGNIARIALGAADLIAPRFWQDTLIVLDPGQAPHSLARAHDPDRLFDVFDEDGRAPMLSCYRLLTAPANSQAEESVIERSLRVKLAQLLGRTEPPTEPSTATRLRPRAEYHSEVTPAVVARVLGQNLAIWLEGTRRPEVITRACAYRTTLTVPDTSGAWPNALQRLQDARRLGWATSHPSAYTVLAADTAAVGDRTRTALAALPDHGDGWYLAARPAAPELPLELEAELDSLLRRTDLDPQQMADELTALRTAEADLLATDPDSQAEGEALTRALALLEIAVVPHDPRLVVDTCVIESGSARGPVAEQWIASLRPEPQVQWDQRLKTRRGRRLLRGHDASQVRQLLSDHAGRLVALFDADRWSGDTRWHAEWPLGLPAGWDDTTLIAADATSDVDTGGQPVLARIQTASEVRFDPVPLPPGHRSSFAFGYGGTGPGVLYDALLRVALDDPIGLGEDFQPPPGSQLWSAITSKGPLRLHWRDVRDWAHRDAAARP